MVPHARSMHPKNGHLAPFEFSTNYPHQAILSTSVKRSDPWRVFVSDHFVEGSKMIWLATHGPGRSPRYLVTGNMYSSITMASCRRMPSILPAESRVTVSAAIPLKLEDACKVSTPASVTLRSKDFSDNLSDNPLALLPCYQDS